MGIRPSILAALLAGAGGAWSPFPSAATSMFKAKISNNGGGGSFQITNGPNTFLIQTMLECPFGRVRIWVANSKSTAVTPVHVTVLAWAAAGADNNIAGNHLSDTWTDAPAAITLAANTNATNQPTWTPTDWITLPSVTRTDSGKTLPGFSVMVDYPTGTNMVTSTAGPGTGGNGWETDGPNVANRFWRVRLNGLNNASNATKAGMTSTVTQNTYWPAIIIEYEPKVVGVMPRTLMLNYDSFGSAPATGINTVVHYGWAERLQAQYSTPSAPIEIVNAAFGGAGTATILATATSIATAVTKAVAIAPNGSGNDTGNSLGSGIVTTWQTWAANYRAMQAAAGNVPVLGTMSPVDPVKAGARAYGATDSYRVAMNAADMALNSHSYIVADISAACSGAPDGSGQIILQNTDDGFHHNDVGGAAIFPAVATALALP